MKQPKIGIIILNWNGEKDTNECLNSLRKVSYKNIEIIVVDNGSRYQSVEKIRKEHPEVMILINKVNIGFTGGNNRGIEYALKNGANAIFLLNNDTVVDPNIFEPLIQKLFSTKQIGIVVPKVMYHSDPEIFQTAGGTFNTWISKARLRGLGQRDTGQFDKTKKVGWVSGAALLAKAEVFHKIGLLNESYFISHEDVEFCRKAINAGYECVYVHKARMLHKVARDSKGLDSPMYVYYQVRNNLLFFRYNVTGIKKWLSFLIFGIVSIPRRILSLMLNKKYLSIQAIGYAILDFLGNHAFKGKRSSKIRVYSDKKKIDIYKIGINARYSQRLTTGIERYLQKLIENLIQLDQKNEYHLFFCEHDPIPKFKHAANIHYERTKFPTKSRVMRIAWEQFFLSFELRKKKIELFHGPSFVVPILKPCKYILNIHDLAYIYYPESYTWINRAYLNIFMRLSIKKADRILAISNSTKDDIIHFFNVPPNKIKVIPLGVDDQFSMIKNKEILTKIRNKYRLPDKFFLFVGLITPRKNIVRIIKAFNIVKKQGLPHQLIIVGRLGWLYEEILREAKSSKFSKEIIFLDYVSDNDIASLYSLADAFVFPSLYEGFGLPILEAMACGCPVITSNVSSMPEVAGDAALLVNPLKSAEIANAMEKITTNNALRTSLQQKGLDQIKKFTWKKCAEETLKVYDTVLKDD